MTFLYPSFLWALLALSIPIIIHLFNFRRAKKIYFSNVKFLENVKESSSSKLKIKYLLVLFSRLMFITFLVLAFAQPFLPGNESGMNSNSVIVYLDNSQSTSNLTETGSSGLAAGLDYLNQIIGLYPTDTKFKIITNDFAPSSINHKTREKALELATEIDYSSLSRGFQDVFNKIELAASDVASNDIYFISDLQESVFKVTTDKFYDSTNTYKIIPIEYEANQNVYIDSLFLESPFLIPNVTNKLHVKLKAVGNMEVNDLLAKLFVNDNQVATTSVDIKQSSSVEIVFDLNFQLQNINKCRISFEDFPITFDNDYYFTLNLLKKIRVTEISGVNSPYLNAVFSENDLFLYKRFDEGAIDFNQALNADLIIFNQINNINNGIVGLQADLMNGGKTTFFIPSENQTLSELSNLLGFSVNKIARSEKIALEVPDLKNPFFEKTFESIDKKTILPTTKPLYSWPPTAQDILTLKNGLPFLSLMKSTGSTYLMSAPLKDEFTDLHKHALFVPIMYRMAALSSNNYFPLAYTINSQLITLDIDTLANNQLYKLSNSNSELIPQQRSASNKLILDIPRYLIEPGYYNLTLSGEVKNLLAFNFTKDESLTSSLNPEERIALFAGIKNLEVLNGQKVENFTQTMKDRYEGRQLWKYALILSLIFLLAEVLLLRFL